jgi:hypothetical protein
MDASLTFFISAAVYELIRRFVDGQNVHLVARVPG